MANHLKILRLILASLLGFFFIGVGVNGFVTAFYSGSDLPGIVLGSSLWTGIGVLIIYAQIRDERKKSIDASKHPKSPKHDFGSKTLLYAGRLFTFLAHLIASSSVLYLSYLIFGHYTSGDASGIPFILTVTFMPLFYFLGDRFSKLSG